MKRFLAAALAALMLISLAACGKKPGGDPQGTPPADAGGLTIGTLYYSGFAIRHTISGLRLSGGRTGGAINEREPAEYGIRGVFELGEEISYKLAFSEQESGACTVCICPHRELSDYKHFDYEKDGICHNSHKLEGGVEGSLCVPAEGNAEGCYDIVFAIDGVLVAYAAMKLLPVGSLEGLTDEQIEALA